MNYTQELLDALKRIVSVSERFLEEQVPSESELYDPTYKSPLCQAREAIKNAEGR